MINQSSPTEIINKSIEIVNGDIFDFPSDLLVIPCSTIGTISTSFQKGLRRLNYEYKEGVISELGSIHVDESFSSTKFKWILFATTVNPDEVDESGTTGVLIKIRSFIIERELKSAVLPLLGAGVGSISPLTILDHVYKTFEDMPSWVTITVAVLGKQMFSKIINSNFYQQRNLNINSNKQFPDNIDYASNQDREINQLYSLDKILNSDTWANDDQLGYEIYAKAISEIIREERNQTKPSREQQQQQ